MSNRKSKDIGFTPNEREAAKAFQRADKRKALTEYEKTQEAFRKNYERLRSERLAREAAKSSGN
jgi:hypothetical protein